VVENKTTVIDLDFESYFDNIKHDILLSKVAQSIVDDMIVKLLKMILKVSGKKGLLQCGVISPPLANIYIN
jgi:RNA-directed DNA polymerase